MPQFEGSTGTEFIALQLALDFEDFDNPEAAAKADKEPKQKPESAAAAPGDAPDKQPAEEQAQPNGLDTDAQLPAEEETAAKPAAAPEAPKPAAAPTKVSYSPILDEEVQNVGICNKAHKKTKNLIQVLYIKAQANAMV